MYEQTIIVGNVGRDPNFKYTSSGVPVCDFSVAVNRRYTTKDGEVHEDTTWYRVTCWRRLAEVANEYIRKGTPIMVVGTVKASAYMDKSGQPAATLELTADTFKLLGRREAQPEAQEDPFAAMPDFKAEGEDTPIDVEF